MKIGKGKLIEEVKGSLNYIMQSIRDAFWKQFPNMGNDLYLNEIFADYVIVSGYGEKWMLKTDEYYKVDYSQSGDVYTFAARDAWEIVELTYKPQTAPENGMNENKKKKGKRFEETITNAIQLVESIDAEKPDGPWRIKAIGITADIINGNGRRYPANVLEAAVRELKSHLHESAGQGRMLSLTGESDHPADKGNRRPLLSETVFNWDKVEFDGQNVLIEGNLLGTSKGKDIHAQMRGGVIPGISQRGYGDSKEVKVNGMPIDEITQLVITGYDATPPNEQSDPFGTINYFESKQGDKEMNLEELLKFMRENPDAFSGITEAQMKKMGAEQLKNLEEQVRSALGIGAGENIAESLKAMREKAGKFDESQKRGEIEAAITDATKDLPFGKKLNEAFTESIKDAKFTSAEGVKTFAESKRKEYGKLAAAGALAGMGFDEKKGIVILGDVLERETGTPEFARASFEITESIRKFEMRPVKDMRKNESRAAQLTVQLLERFDKMYQRQLMLEAQQFNEAEAASDLNLPYSVSRAVMAEAFPTLVAANVFDIGLMNGSPENIWYEAFAGETGYTVAITDEVVTGGAESTWYAMAHANVTPGTVVVTSNPAGTTWVEGTDFVIDYELGKIKFLAAGGINADDVLVDYSYSAITEGEGAEIQQAKTTMSYQTLTARAFRVADQINSEAIIFSRTQLGWDAVGRTMANIIRETRRIIDRHLIEKALASSLSVASNSGGTWTAATDPFNEFAEKLGYAKVKVANRFYEPTGFLMSVTNSDMLSNWDGFTRTGFPNALLDAAGFVGAVKGLPVFASTQMRDGWALCLNREIVMHRILQPMTVKGPFPTYGANRKVIAADQYYSEEYSGTLSPIANKASHVVVA